MADSPRKEKRKEGKAPRGLASCLALGAAVLAAVLCLYMVQPPLLRQMDNHAYDLFLRLCPGGEPPPGIVIVDIDEKSIEAVGQWPWPRYLTAALLERLHESGAAAVGLDVLFSEADRSSVAHVRAAMERFLGQRFRVEDLPDSLLDNDALFAGVLAGTPAVLSMYLRFEKGAEASPERAAHARRDAPPPAPGLIVHDAGPAAGTAEKPAPDLFEADAAILPLPVFLRAAPAAFFNAAFDKDGLLRRVPLLLRYRDAVYPSLALGVLLRARGEDNLFLQTRGGMLQGVEVGDLAIPLSPDGTMLVPFRGPGFTYPYLSAVDVLAGGTGETDVRGALVFVGSSAAGLRDIRATPFDRHMPGVEVHAAVVDAVLSGRFVVIPDWTPGLQFLGITAIGLACGLLFGRTRAPVYVPLAAALAGGILAGTWRAFIFGMFISPVYLLLTVAAEGFFVLALRFWQEEKQKSHLRQAFSRYVAPEVVARIARQERDILGGEERPLTVLFSDIRGFTPLSETLTPQQIVRLLNSYFTPMTALVRRQGGTLDKFIGDALMAFWNAPLDSPGHPALAVETALRMQELLPQVNAVLKEQCGASIAIGVGVHTGAAYVGNMGSEDLLAYTAIGDTVNIAARLEGLCSLYGAGVIVSGSTAALCSEDGFVFQLLDVIRVKGKSAAVEALAPLRPEEARARKEELAAYAGARAAYAAGDFSGAAAAFAHLREGFAMGLYALYAERCRKMARRPPPNWDGVWSLEKKSF